MYIRNPVEWSLDQLKSAGTTIEFLVGGREDLAAQPTVRRIDAADIYDALSKGLDDFVAFRSDVALICLIYPLVGLILARLAFGYALLPLV